MTEHDVFRNRELLLSRYRALSNFFGGYLNQEWDYDYPDLWAVVDDFAQLEVTHAPNIRAEVESVLSRIPDELELKRILIKGFGMGYLVEVDGWTYRGWLLAFVDRVDEIRTFGREGASPAPSAALS